MRNENLIINQIAGFFIAAVTRRLNMEKALLEKLEILENKFDEYHKKQMQLTETPNADYYLYMGKAAGIGEAIDLLKNENT